MLLQFKKTREIKNYYYLAQNSYNPSNTGQSSPTLKCESDLVKPYEILNISLNYTCFQKRCTILFLKFLHT